VRRLHWSALLVLAALGVGGAASAQTAPTSVEVRSLQDAVQLALTRHERAAMSAEREAASSARVRRARAFFFPTLAAQGAWTRRPGDRVANVGGSPVVIQAQNAFAATASFQLTLFNGALFPLYRAAVWDAEAAGFEAQNELRLLAFEAADAYLLTLSAQQVRAAAERRQSFAGEALKDAEVRAQAGLVSSNDVTRARLEVATADQGATSAQGTAAGALLQLAFLVDAPVAAALQDVDGLFPAEPVAVLDPDALARQAAEERPDLKALSRRAEAAEVFAEEPLWRYLPSLGLGAQYRITNEAGLTGRSQDWSAGVTLNWVLWDGGVRGAERAERVAQASIARLNARLVERRAALEVRAALVALHTADAGVRQARVAAEVAQRNAEEAGTLYGQGLARAIEVTDAAQRLFEAEVALTRQRYARAIAWLDLRAALGLDPLGREVSQ
jgi:outer membrane protein TolC